MRSSTKNNRTKATVCAILLMISSTTIFFVVKSNESEPYELDSYHYESAVSQRSRSPENSDWRLILVNAWNTIPKDYEVVLEQLKNNFKVDKRIYPELQEMFDAARNEGIFPHINSAYRTKVEQEDIFIEKVRAYRAEGHSESDAEELAKTWVALPGTSEHELGLAVDINADKEKSSNDDVYQWLAKNAYKYGFVLRYPADKVEITGVSYEPWHYRYVGKEVAKELYEQEVCLEEYLENQK